MMHSFLKSLVLLAFFLPNVIALVASGGFEKVWLWYAYQIDQLNPAGQRHIAIGCVSANTARTSCTFTEFIGHIEKDGPEGTEYLTDPNERMPPVTATADHIRTEGWANRQLDLTKIMPRVSNPVFPGMPLFVSRVIENTHANLTPEERFNNAELFDRAKFAIGEIIGFRQADSLRHLTTQVQARLNTNAFRGVTATLVNTAYGTGLIDMQATINSATGNRRRTLINLERNFQNTPIFTNHQSGISAFQRGETRISPLQCLNPNPPSPTKRNINGRTYLESPFPA